MCLWQRREPRLWAEVTDLVDHQEEGIEKHQLMLLHWEDVTLLHCEDDGSYQGDLSGTADAKTQKSALLSQESNLFSYIFNYHADIVIFQTS